MSRGYFHYILIQEYGHPYKIEIRDNLALLQFTKSPLITPHFFIKGSNGWQMDIFSEVGNCRNRVGGVYTWDYRGSSDAYTKAFIDKFVNIKGYVRLIDGDNREIPVRQSH